MQMFLGVVPTIDVVTARGILLRVGVGIFLREVIVGIFLTLVMTIIKLYIHLRLFFRQEKSYWS